MSWELEGGALDAKGRNLPDGMYKAQVEVAAVEDTDNGKRVSLQFGELTTPEGNTEFVAWDGTEFRIGNRKLFQRSWWEHTNETAQSIGHKELAKLMIATGLVQRPEKGQKFASPYATADELVQQLEGKTMLVRVKAKNRTRKMADGSRENVMDDDGMQVVDVNIVDWKPLS